MFYLDFNGENFIRGGTLENSLDAYVSPWEEDYGLSSDKELVIGYRFIKLLEQVRKQTVRRAVVLIDEYDKPILDVLDTNVEMTVDGNRVLVEDWNRDVLKGFYSVFKAADEHLQFVFLTGITKFSQVSVFSRFNQPKDISMDRRYELESYFAEQIVEMAEMYHCDVPEMKHLLKRQYDGYHFSPRLIDVYNPFYLLMCLVSVYTVYTEKQQSEGRVDCIVETDGYVYIFEFKLEDRKSVV